MTHNDSLKRALLVGFNLVVIVCLLLSANGFYLADQRGLFGAGAANALVIPDNALVYNFKLTRLRVTDASQATVLDTQTGQVSGQAVLDGIRSGQGAIGPTLDGRVKPDLVAPGVNVSSTWVGGGFATKSGTSMAAPHVAGVAALLLDAYSITPPLVSEALVTTAMRLPGYDRNAQGNGRVDGDAASAYIAEKLAAASTQTLPGDTGVYTCSVTNLGNVADSFSLAWNGDDLPATALAYPATIPAGWVRLSPSSVTLASGGQATGVVQITVPADWAGMEATTYRFRLSATSQAEPEVSDTDLAFLSIQATKRSKVEYARLEVGWLRGKVSALPRSAGYLAKLDAAGAKVQAALDGLVAGDLIRANTSLDAAINKMEAFVNEVRAQRGKRLDAVTADRLTAEANAIIAHLLDARTTAME